MLFLSLLVSAYQEQEFLYFGDKGTAIVLKHCDHAFDDVHYVASPQLTTVSIIKELRLAAERVGVTCFYFMLFKKSVSSELN